MYTFSPSSFNLVNFVCFSFCINTNIQLFIRIEESNTYKQRYLVLSPGTKSDKFVDYNMFNIIYILTFKIIYVERCCV